MDRALMSAFRLVGAQIKTVKAEMTKSRPKGSPKVTVEQRALRNEARIIFEQAAGIYLAVERQQYEAVDPSRELCEASQQVYAAQVNWRQAHPSDGRMVEVVKL